MIAVFHGGHTAEDIRVGDDLQTDLHNVLRHAREALGMADVRAELLAHADDDHLEDAALDGAADVRVGLDAADGNDPVRLRRIAVDPRREAVRLRNADLHRLHARADGRAGIFLGNAEIGENFLLSLGLRACVAAHGRDDERLCAVLAHDLTDRADNERDVCDLARACRDADALAGLQLLQCAALLHHAPRLCRNVLELRRGARILDAVEIRHTIVLEQGFKNAHACGPAFSIRYSAGSMPRSWQILTISS